MCAFVEEENRRGGSRGQHENHAEGNESVADDGRQIPRGGGIVEILHEHNHRKDRLVGIHAGDHRQQRGDEQHRHRAVDAATQQQASDTDRHRSAQRRRSDIHACVHQAETQGMPHGGQQGDRRKGPHRRIGHGSESDGRHRGEKSVRKNGEQRHSNPFLTIIRVHDNPTAMQTISISADVRRAIPFNTCPSTMSITPLISGTPGIR